MPTLISVREASSITKFAGDYPNISYYPGVNADLLTEGDDNPMFITMRIAEVGRVSANGLLYDQDLVAAIAEQLKGLGGIQGHIPAGEEASTFKIDAIDWVGHALVEGVLWAKGYIPPGDTREYVRRIRARAGSLGTSIFGYGHRDFVDDEQTVWKSLDFDLHSVDLAPAKMASLDMGGDFKITSETSLNQTTSEEGKMPEIMTLANVPQSIREQIIRQAQLEANAERVSELEGQVADLTTQIAEMEAHTSSGATRISELETIVSEQDSALANYRAAEFAALLDTRIAEGTQWQVNDETKRQKLAALRQRLRRDTLAELTGQDHSEDQIEAALQQAFQDNQLIIETMRDALGGPKANIGGLDNKQAAGTWESYKDNPADLNQRWGTSLSDS